MGEPQCRRDSRPSGNPSKGHNPGYESGTLRLVIPREALEAIPGFSDVDAVDSEDPPELTLWAGDRMLAFELAERCSVTVNRGTVANTDANGAENIRQQSISESIEDGSTGWLAQPAVRLFDKSRGDFLPSERVTREP